MLTEFAREACGQTYCDVKDLIHETCSRFVRVNGGDLEEAVSVANMTFLKVYMADTFDPSLSSFPIWIRNKIRYALLEEMRNRIGKNNRMPRKQLDLERVGVDPKGSVFDRESLYLYLSEDARFILDMVFDDHLPLLLEVYTGNGEYTAGNVRKGLRHVLKDLGWGWERVMETFEEIRQILS